MKSTKSLLFALILLVGQFTFQAYAINDIVTVGATGSTYTTLKLAFDAINAGTLTGAVQLQIKDNTTETQTATLTAAGGLSSITVNAGGSGYSTGSTVTISAPPAGGITATAKVFAVSSGAITSFTITNPGSGYITPPTVTIGTGTGANTTAVLANPSFSSVLIYPTVTGKTITGGISGALITLSGSNDITLDGRLRNVSGVLTGTTADLTINNTIDNTTPMTIQLTANASNNTITYCNIKGSSTSTSKAAIVLIAPTTASSTGCAYNTISKNVFTPSTVIRPWTVIYSAGISGAVNTGNIVQDNDFKNCLSTNSNVESTPKSLSRRFID
jgi:hypothetical protein